MRGGLGSSSIFGTGTRYKHGILHQCGKMVKTKSQKVFGANFEVFETFLHLHILNRVDNRSSEVIKFLKLVDFPETWLSVCKIHICHVTSLMMSSVCTFGQGLKVDGVDYCCITSAISQSEAENLTKNADLSEKGGTC